MTGIGILVYRVSMSGSLSLHAMSGFDTSYMLNGDSSHQSSTEFIAIVCAIMLCLRTGISHAGVSIQGDNLTALSWAASEQIRSSRALGASWLFVNLLIGSGFDIADTNHIEDLLNTTSDRLSREMSALDLGIPDACFVDLCHALLVLTLSLLWIPRFALPYPRDIPHTFVHSRSLVDMFLRIYSDWNVLASM